VAAAKAVAATPNDVQARAALVKACAGHNFTAALDLLRKTLAEPGLLPDAEQWMRHLLCRTLIDRGQAQEAEAELARLLRAAAARPGYITQDVLRRVVLLRAQIRILQRRFGEARTELDRLLVTPNLLARVEQEARTTLADLERKRDGGR
jgi:hypothetical protein